MGFLERFSSQKNEIEDVFKGRMPIQEIPIPSLRDASAFTSEMPEGGLDGADEKNHWKGGGLKNVYRSRLGFEKERCPLCSNETKQKYIALVYASDVGIRQSFAPSAWICEPCSCVVLDETLPVQSAHWKGYSYLFPLGMASVETFFEFPQDNMHIFTAYEGKKPVFVFDGDTKDVIDIRYVNETNSSTSLSQFGSRGMQQKQISEAKRRQKRKAEKQARKKQRN